MLMENRMRGNVHVRLGGGPGETERPKDRHRAPGLPNWTPTIALELRKRDFDVIAISEPAHAGRYA